MTGTSRFVINIIIATLRSGKVSELTYTRLVDKTYEMEIK